jgi:hypothetical protein
MYIDGVEAKDLSAYELKGTAGMPGSANVVITDAQDKPFDGGEVRFVCSGPTVDDRIDYIGNQVL